MRNRLGAADLCRACADQKPAEAARACSDKQMNEKARFDLHFAMEVYGVRALLGTAQTTAHLATTVLDRASRACAQLKDVAMVQEVGCSSTYIAQMGGLFEFDLYIRYSIPPRSQDALKIMSHVFENMDVVRLEMHNPFSKPACGLKDSSHALSVIRQNQKEITSMVTEGGNFYLIKPDSNVWE